MVAASRNWPPMDQPISSTPSRPKTKPSIHSQLCCSRLTGVLPIPRWRTPGIGFSLPVTGDVCRSWPLQRVSRPFTRKDLRTWRADSAASGTRQCRYARAVAFAGGTYPLLADPDCVVCRLLAHIPASSRVPLCATYHRRPVPPTCRIERPVLPGPVAHDRNFTHTADRPTLLRTRGNATEIWTRRG